MSVKRLFFISGFIILIFFICINSQVVETGCREGLLIWYNSLVPVVLPFCLISGLFMSGLKLSSLKTPAATIIMLICGLFMGYPIGSIVAGRLYDNNSLSKNTICAFMPLCNNVSPMFLVGYIYHDILNNSISLISLLCYIYVPELIYSCFYLILSKISCKRAENITPAFSEYAATDMPSDPNEFSSLIDRSIHTICIIGIYVVIFSIISALITAFNHDNNMYINVLSCYMEVTSGIQDLLLLPLPQIKKAALILSLSAFGGISAIFQSVHILKQSKLPVSKYILSKIICGVGTYIMVLVV